MYKVTEKDLIGDIKDFPIEIVQKMIDEQTNQGNPADVSVFQEEKHEGSPKGGFDWCKTTDGKDFWSQAIVYKNFDLFFDKYPKEHEDDFWIDPKGRRMLVWDYKEELATERLVIAKFPGLADIPYMAVSSGDEGYFIKGKKYNKTVWLNAKPIPEKEEAVELTLEQIADKFGISVDRLKIKK